MLTDTVGFIRHIPPQLTAAFTATLGELHEADLLLHVTDVSHPATTSSGRPCSPSCANSTWPTSPASRSTARSTACRPGPAAHRAGFAAAVAVSAATGERLDELLARIGSLLSFGGEREFLVPYGRLGALTRLRGEGRILGEVALPEGLRVRVRLDEAAAARLARALALPSVMPG